MARSVIIIGAGIAGLSAGCYAQLNGYRSDIFEMHSQPGGLCAAWERKDYVFDGSMQWLVGTNPDSPLRPLWQEIGGLGRQTIINHDDLARVEEDGRELIFYSSADRLKEHLSELSPQDMPLIEELYKGILSFSDITVDLDKPQELYNIIDHIRNFVKLRPLHKDLMQFSNMSVEEFAGKFQDPLLRRSFALLMPGEYSMLALLNILSALHQRDAGYPIGGSTVFVNSIVTRYHELGGELHLNTPVKRILVKNHKAIGVELADGSKHYADIVLSSADGYATLFKLLEGQYVPTRLYRYFKELTTYTSVQVSLGIAADLSDQPHSIYVPLEQPSWLGGVEHRFLPVRHFCYDPSAAPPGHSVVVSVLPASFDYWNQLKADSRAYQQAKNRLCDAVTDTLARRFPQTEGAVEAADVATPLAFSRYTNVWRGAYMGWIQTPESGEVRIPKTLPGLSNFFMAGQWTQSPAGLPGSMLSGRCAVQLLCRQDGKTFVSPPKATV